MQIKAQELSLNRARHHFTVGEDRLSKRFPRELLEFAFVEVLKGKWEAGLENLFWWEKISRGAFQPPPV